MLSPLRYSAQYGSGWVDEFASQYPPDLVAESPSLFLKIMYVCVACEVSGQYPLRQDHHLRTKNTRGEARRTGEKERR